MNTNIEFFDVEPMENLITCLNFKMDRVIFFGHKDTMNPQRVQNMRRSMENICGITDVKFVEVSKTNLDRVIEVIEDELRKERQQGNRCFFDLTGGEDLLLVALGILSAKHQMPMHRFHVKNNELTVLNHKVTAGIDEIVPKRHIKLTLDDAIAIRGGVINYRQQKLSKSFLDNQEFERDVAKIWKVVKDSPRRWNGLSGMLKKLTDRENGNFTVSVSNQELSQIIRKCSGIIFRQAIVCMRELEQYGILENVRDGEYVSFKYKNEVIKECLLDAGCPLELHTYFEKRNSGRYVDCRVGVHIDWDGVLHSYEEDVENEIDVLALDGYVPIFTSCKNGKVNQMALYELETVTDRFGGKYAQKEIAATQQISEAYTKRAQEMDIRIVYQ